MLLEKEIIDYKMHKKDILHWVKLKGEYRYAKIIRYMKKNNVLCTWDNVTAYIKYDKRILINCFKYIVFLEEMYKSFIKEENPATKIELMSFRTSYNLFLNLEDFNTLDGIDIEVMRSNNEAINDFRNKVVHNNILLGRNFKGQSLKSIIQNFALILPNTYSKGFISDIKKCSYDLDVKRLLM